MARRLFDFKSDKHFVASSDKTTLKVYELTNPTLHPCHIRKSHWKEVANIISSPDHHHDDGDDDDEEEEEEESSYDGLMFFDGHGKIEGREALTKLAQLLTRLQLMVSPGGQCFQDVAELGEHKDFGIHYLRLNDLFNWPHHGVHIASTAATWRLVLKYTMPKRENKTNGGGGVVSKEKYEELKKMVRKKEEEMEEQDRELEALREEREVASEQQEAALRALEKRKNGEMWKYSKKKDGELRLLEKELKEKNDELEMVKKRERDDGAKVSEEKDEQLRTLRDEVENLRKKEDGELRVLEKELKEKNGELEMMKREKDDGAKVSKEKDEQLKTLRDEVANLRKKEDEAASTKGKIMVDSDEWHKLKNNKDEELQGKLENEKKHKEALQKSMNEKDLESQKLRREKQEMMQANAVETRTLRDQMSQLHELEQRRKQPFVWTGATQFLREYTVDVRKRRPVPHDTWYNVKVEVPSDCYYVYGPYTAGGSSQFPMINWLTVNEEPNNDWPPPPKVGVHCQPGQFDKHNWWLVKTAHPGGRLAMMAYYEGSQTSFTTPGYLYPVRLPYPRDSKLYTTRQFFLIEVNGARRFAFTYQD